MRTEVIQADTIEAATEKILIELGADTRRSRENTIYFDGWDGLGASAVLQAIAERLAISEEFDKIINIDCSKWESRRAMQRKIAEQLELPNRVMEMLDKQDEEDDFNGLDQGSRREIAEVVGEIIQTVQNRRFLVILHNGSNEEIDIFDFGLSGYVSSKMLWTFQGRFRLDPKMIDNVRKSTTTDVLLSASSHERDPQELWSYLLHQEAAQVSCNKHGHGIIDPAIAAKCVLYMLKQSWISSHIIDHDWAIHTSNYWICDGIIIPQGVETEIDKAWQVGDVLQREVRLLNMDNRLNNDELTKAPSSHLARYLARSVERMPHWIAAATCGFVPSPSGVIPDNMFGHSDRLGVLKLSRCTFSFSSPPFLCCHGLRFLWIDHCQDLLPTRSTTDHHHTDAEKEEQLDSNTMTLWACFQSLWVLDLRYTDWDRILSAQMMDLMTELRELNVMGAKNWDMSHLRGRLRNIRKLRVTKSTCSFNNNVFSEMESMELLDFSGNHITQGMTSLSGPARSSSLETLIIDGCDGLENISLRGCTELKNLLLKGLLNGVEELDLSGTRVKTLNLVGVEALGLKRLILLGCQKLVAILWPPKRERWPDVLRINNTSTSASADGSEAPHSHPHGDRSLQQQKEEKFNRWQISVTDARLLRSLHRDYFCYGYIHIDICDAATLGGSNVQGKGSDKLVQVQPHTGTMVNTKYKDVLMNGPVAAMMMWEWNCPKIPYGSQTCIIEVIMHGQDAQSASTGALLLPDLICGQATSLHVYDNSSITSIPEPPGGSGWDCLSWCRVERCPKLHRVFTIPQGSDTRSFRYLKTFWASQLLIARYIWDRTTTTAVYSNYKYFGKLTFLHVDYCPRLIHVLPLSMDEPSLGNLETLEIICCGDLREVFPLVPERQEQDTVKELKLPWLRRIHLHELPTLQHICRRRISAPNLETIKIRGCWSLRRLPAIGRDTEPPKVDCEKEWWDKLEWDGVEAFHHHSLYQPSHSLYYKNAQLPRGTLLR